MQEKRKKFWIIFSLTICSVLLISLIFGIITNLKSVNVEFRQRINAADTRLESNILEKVKNDGEFEYGKGLLFVDVNASIDKIEKKNPFVKVEQVIRKFPNSISVYLSERVPTSYFDDGTSFYVLDKEFKVLDKISKSEQGDAYLEENYLQKIYKIDFDFGFASYETGEFISENENIKLLKQVRQGIVGAQESSTGVKSLKIDQNKVIIIMKKDNVVIDDGVKIEIDGLDDLVVKTFVAVEFFETIDKQTSAGTIKVKKSESENNKYHAYIEN